MKSGRRVSQCGYYGDPIEEMTGTPEDSEVYEGPENTGLEYAFCNRSGSTVNWEFLVFRPAPSATRSDRRSK